MVVAPVAAARIILRHTEAKDLKYVTALEQAVENRRFVSQETEAEHQQMLDSPDFVHLIVQRDEYPVGFVILAGLTGVSASIELKRLVIEAKGQGLGREALRLSLELAFKQYQAHRLWLDVVDYNERAIQLYRSLGFRQEGLLRECDWFEGKYNSLLIMSILRREYEQGSTE